MEMDVVPFFEIVPPGREEKFDISPMTRDEAVAGFGWLVERLAKQYVHDGVEFDDLVQEGYFGLFKAVEQWRAEAGAKFKTLAASRIRDELRRASKTDDRYEFLSLDADNEENLSTHELLGQEPEQEELLNTEEESEQVRKALAKLSDEDRSLLEMFAADISTPEIGRRKGIPRETARDRCNLALAKLHDVMRRAA